MGKTSFALFAALTFVAGCGGGDDTTTGGGDDMAMVVYKIQSGGYTVSALAKGADGCMMALETAGVGFEGSKVNVANNGNGALDLGSLKGPSDGYNPQVYSQGSGTFSDLDHETTTMTTHVTASSTCEYDLQRDNVVTVTGNNKMHIEFTNKATNVLAACSVPPSPSCTSTYSYDLAM